MTRLEWEVARKAFCSLWSRIGPILAFIVWSTFALVKIRILFKKFLDARLFHRITYSFSVLLVWFQFHFSTLLANFHAIKWKIPLLVVFLSLKKNHNARNCQGIFFVFVIKHDCCGCQRKAWDNEGFLDAEMSLIIAFQTKEPLLCISYITHSSLKFGTGEKKCLSNDNTTQCFYHIY